MAWGAKAPPYSVCRGPRPRLQYNAGLAGSQALHLPQQHSETQPRSQSSPSWAYGMHEWTDERILGPALRLLRAQPRLQQRRPAGVRESGFAATGAQSRGPGRVCPAARWQRDPYRYDEGGSAPTSRVHRRPGRDPSPQGLVYAPAQSPLTARAGPIIERIGPASRGPGRAPEPLACGKTHTSV